MFCKNCGKEIENTAQFCGGCGSRVEVQVNTQAVEQTLNKDNRNKKIMIAVGAVVALVVAFIAFGFHLNNKCVDTVKNGAFNDYPGILIEKAFDNYFSETKWEYDGAEDDYDLVKFTGLYETPDEISNIVIRFEVFDDDSFLVHDFTIDGMKHEDYVYSELITRIMEEYGYTYSN